jgi:hypothetical protein
MAKARFDYASIGLTKLEGVTLFNGEGITAMNEDIKAKLADYGLFVKLTRALAGHEKDSNEEKKAILTEMFNMLKDGKMTTGKRTRTTADPFKVACDKVWLSDAAEKIRRSTIKGLENAFNKTYDFPEIVTDEETEA